MVLSGRFAETLRYLAVCATWFAAGNVLSADSSPMSVADISIDIAPSARVVTSDPSRIQGTLAKRNDPMPAKDIFLTTELKPEPDGSYRVPLAVDGRSAIGLEWPEMRILRRLELHWGDGAAMPSADGVQLQYWVGFQGRGKFDLWYDNRSCSWQGGWRPPPNRSRYESTIERRYGGGFYGSRLGIWLSSR